MSKRELKCYVMTFMNNDTNVIRWVTQPTTKTDAMKTARNIAVQEDLRKLDVFPEDENMEDQTFTINLGCLAPNKENVGKSIVGTNHGAQNQ